SSYFTSAMNAVRLGSYSRRSTVAGTSHLRRLKSMKRYFCLWPPAIPREVTWPLLLRPPVLRLPSVSALTGLPFHSADLSTRFRPRCAGLVGLLCLSAISLPSRARSDARGDVDRLAFGQADDRLLHVAARVGLALPALGLALGDQRVDAEHLDVEQRLDGRLDRRLGRVVGDAEDDGVILAEQRRLFGDHRSEDHVIVTRVDGL